LSFFIDFSSEGEAAEGLLQRYQQPDLPDLAPAAGSLLTILIPMLRP
jgi:hypothetical protein